MDGGVFIHLKLWVSVTIDDFDLFSQCVYYTQPDGIIKCCCLP